MIKVKKNGAILVVFLQNEHAYAAGRLAGFDPAKAQDLTSKKIARYATLRDIPGRESTVTVVEREAPVVVETPDVEKSHEAPEDDSDLDQILADPEWRSMNGNKLRAIAKKVSDSPVTSKDDAIAAIELALEERAGR